MQCQKMTYRHILFMQLQYCCFLLCCAMYFQRYTETETDPDRFYLGRKPTDGLFSKRSVSFFPIKVSFFDSGRFLSHALGTKEVYFILFLLSKKLFAKNRRIPTTFLNPKTDPDPDRKPNFWYKTRSGSRPTAKTKSRWALQFHAFSRPQYARTASLSLLQYV
jgi:hypothetical protein